MSMLAMMPEMKMCSQNELKKKAEIGFNSHRVLCEYRPTSVRFSLNIFILARL